MKHRRGLFSRLGALLLLVVLCASPDRGLSAELSRAGATLGLEDEGLISDDDSAVTDLDSPDASSPNQAIDSVPAPGQIQGLQIGSFEGGADAVANGAVLPGWTIDAPASISESESRTRFWALLGDPNAVDAPLDELLVTSSDQSVVTASVNRQGASDDDSSSNALRGASVGSVVRPLVTDIVYACHRAGAVHLTVTFKFADHRVTPVQLSLTKVCAARKRQGLDLGTSADRFDDVVHNGVSRWASASATQRLIPPATSQVQLFLSLLPSGGADDTAFQMLQAPRVKVTNLASKGVSAHGPPKAEVRRWRRLVLAQSRKETWFQRQGQWGLQGVGDAIASNDKKTVKVRFSGDLQDGGSLAMTPAQESDSSSKAHLSVELECMQEGTALVEVEITPYPAYQPYRPSVVTFVKQCGGVVQRGFDVATSDITEGKEADLVRDGAIVGSMGDISNLESEAVVYWRNRQGRSIGAPDAVRLVCDGGIASGSVAPARISSSEESEGLTGRQDLRFACVKEGVSTCTLQMKWKLYDGPALQFKKVCGGVRTDVDIESDSTPGAPLVLLAGKAQSAWGETNPQVTLPPEEDSTTFTVSLDQELKPGETSLRIAPPQIRVYRPDVVRALIVGDLVNGGEVQSVEDGADLEVQMECLTTGTSRIEVTLPIGQGPSFKPLGFSFSKRCVMITYYQQWWFISVLTFVGVFLLSCTIMLFCVFRFQTKLQADLEAGGKGKEMGPVGEDSEEEDES